MTADTRTPAEREALAKTIFELIRQMLDDTALVGLVIAFDQEDGGSDVHVRTNACAIHAPLLLRDAADMIERAEAGDPSGAEGQSGSETLQ